jgi:hypothetical protein
MHVTPPGQALGLALVDGAPVLVSCVLDLTSVVENLGQLQCLTSTGSYADKLFLQQGRPESILMHVPSGKTQHRFIMSVTKAMHSQAPVRVLIKHSPGACLLPFVDVAVLSCEKIINDPKLKLIHYLGLGYVTSVSSAAFTLQVNGPPSAV